MTTPLVETVARIIAAGEYNRVTASMFKSPWANEQEYADGSWKERVDAAQAAISACKKLNIPLPTGRGQGAPTP